MGFKDKSDLFTSYIAKLLLQFVASEDILNQGGKL